MRALKSRTPSAPRDVQYQSWRIASPGTSAPQLNLDMSPFSMSTQNGSYAPSPSRSLSPPKNRNMQDQATPSRPPPRRPSRLRQSSGLASMSREQSPGPNGDSPQASELGDNSFTTPTSATPSGTSGAVIERLTANNDRLKRDLNAEIQQRLQLEQENEVLTKKISSLTFENENLQQAKDTDAHLLKRSDKRIDDLKRRLEMEQNQRQHNEGQVERLRTERDEAVEDCRNQTSQANSRMQQAVNCADVWESSHRQLKDEYQHRMDAVTGAWEAARRDAREERRRVHRLNLVVEQMNQQMEAYKKVNADMAVEMEAYEKRSRQLEKQAEADAKVTQRAKELIQDTQHLLNITKNTARREGLI